MLCFRALLLNLNSCYDASCSREQIPDLRVLLDNIYNNRLHKNLKNDSEPEECSLAFLRSQTVLASVRHWISLLLNATNTEATKGRLKIK